MLKDQLAVYVCFFSLLSLLQSGSGQETCSSGLVGFTALTPEQLREEISESMQKSLSEALEATELNSKNQDSAVMDAIESMNDSLRMSQERLINDLEVSLRDYIQQTVSEAVKSITREFQEANPSLDDSTLRPPITTSPTSPPFTSPPFTSPPPLGLTFSNPASSCLKIQETIIGAQSGFYWISGNDGSSPVSVYCDMTRTCGDLTGGWMRVANIDMTNKSQQCPGDFVEVLRSETPKRVCASNSNNGGCYSHSFPVPGAGYSNVCGKIIGYQNRTTNSFFPYHVKPSLTIEDIFLDGIVLTHGNPRSHVWSFVAALDETLDHTSGCACSNSHMTSPSVPSFVGEDYFCDTGSEEEVDFIFYHQDPLWDGKGCGPDSTCCQFNNPPWFFKKLSSPSSTTDAIEMRVCRDASSSNEDTPFEIIELYVR